MSRPRNRARPSKRPIRDVYSSADKKRVYPRPSQLWSSNNSGSSFQGRRRAGSSPQTDGPPPRNTMRRKNAADHFWNEHQEEYEARARSSGCRMRAVREHCETYPQLRDQVLKRRSDAKPAREARFYSAAELCAHCRRLCAQDLGRRGLPRAPSSSRGVRKAKSPRSNAAHLRRRPKIRRNVLTVYRKPYFTSDSTVYSLESLKNSVDGEKQEPDPAQRSRDVDSEVSRITERKQQPAPSEVASAVSGAVSPGSRNSMSSYHSFGSMGQPPIG